VTDWLTFRRIQAGSGTRLGLLLLNAMLLAIILLGLLYLPHNPSSHSGATPGMTLQVAAFLLPLACNVLYLSIGNRPSKG
jgi:hypothetical protein